MRIRFLGVFLDVIALNFADADFATPAYREYMLEKVSPLLTADKTALVVRRLLTRPASGLSFGVWGMCSQLDEAVLQFVRLSSWPAAWYEQQQNWPGTEHLVYSRNGPGQENGRLYHEAPLLNPQDGIADGKTAPSRRKTWGLARHRAEVFATPFGTGHYCRHRCLVS